jgi:hypothetical protein
LLNNYQAPGQVWHRIATLTDCVDGIHKQENLLIKVARDRSIEKVMDKGKVITWLTGAGRCGTHLVANLLDGSEGVFVFPDEFRATEIWGAACAFTGVRNAIKLPVAALELGSSYPLRLRQYSAARLTLAGYMAGLARQAGADSARALVFHWPGCRLAAYLRLNVDDHLPLRVVILLRHPVQNYLAWINHRFQSGRPLMYSNDRVSIFHESMGYVVNAFNTADEYKDHPDVLVTRLEEFTTSFDERARVYEFCGVDPAKIEETTTQSGKRVQARSGIHTGSGIQPVTESDYPPLLIPQEYEALELFAARFEHFYPGWSAHLEVVSPRSARQALKQRHLQSWHANRMLRWRRRRAPLAILRALPHPRRAVPEIRQAYRDSYFSHRSFLGRELAAITEAPVSLLDYARLITEHRDSSPRPRGENGDDS